MRKCELIKQSKLLEIKSKILSNLFNEKYGIKLGEFNNTTGTERVKYLGLPFPSVLNLDMNEQRCMFQRFTCQVRQMHMAVS